MLNGTIDLALVPLGLALGVLVNWAIYSCAMINPRRVSPWTRFASEPIDAIALVPIIGWWWQRSRATEFGRGFWIRPLLIEVAFAVAVPAVYHYVNSGGLTSSELAMVSVHRPAQVWAWWGLITALAGLLTAATFIDFDEKTIPDEITLTGTLCALAMAWLVPISALPFIRFLQPGVAVEHLHFASPDELPTWHFGPGGLWVGLMVIATWMWAITPKRVTWRRGLGPGLRTMWLSIFPPPRRGRSPLLLRPRRVQTLTKLAIVLTVLLACLTTAAWLQGGARWTAYFSALAGLGMGGGIVWSVRIIASQALGQEAMGFGDVTLMAMIGAFLGWQASVLVFCFAPFAAMVIAIVQMIVTRRPEIAFGPYLSLAAVFLVLNWGRLWNDWAAPQVFVLGPILLAIVAVCLVLMAGMLWSWQRVKASWHSD